MSCSSSNIVPIDSDWPLRAKSFRQKFDNAGRLIWDDHLTSVLLTGMSHSASRVSDHVFPNECRLALLCLLSLLGAVIFPPYEAPTSTAGVRYGRNEVLAVYVLAETGVFRTPRQCGSKIQHLATSDDMKRAIQDKAPCSEETRTSVLTCILPLLPTVRAAVARANAVSQAAASLSTYSNAELLPPPKPKPYTGPTAVSFRVSSGSLSSRHDFLQQQDSRASTSQSFGLAVLDDVPRQTPVLKVHIVLPPRIDVSAWNGIRVEIEVPGANNIEYHTVPFVASSPAPNISIKAIPVSGSKFLIPVASGFLADILSVWGKEEQRRNFIPDVTIVQTFKARRKGGKLCEEDFLAVVYTFGVAKRLADASVHVVAAPPDEPTPGPSSASASTSPTTSPTLTNASSTTFPLVPCHFPSAPESLLDETTPSTPSSSGHSQTVGNVVQEDIVFLSPPVPMSEQIPLATPVPRLGVEARTMPWFTSIPPPHPTTAPVQEEFDGFRLTGYAFTPPSFPTTHASTHSSTAPQHPHPPHEHVQSYYPYEPQLSYDASLYDPSVYINYSPAMTFA